MIRNRHHKISIMDHILSQFNQTYQACGAQCSWQLPPHKQKTLGHGTENVLGCLHFVRRQIYGWSVSSRAAAACSIIKTMESELLVLL
jgi:hypothetical protein